MPGDGTYSSPSGQTTCRDGKTIDIPDEIGKLRTLRDGRLRLRPSNLREIRRVLRQCTRRKFSASSRQWVEIAPNGRELTGLARTHVTTYAELPIQQSIVSHMVGRLGLLPEPIVLPPSARICPPQLTLRCTER
jgi:hypothetical protein